MKKRVLILSQYFAPDITAAAFRIKDMYEAFKQADLEVTVITTYPHKAGQQNKALEEEADIHRLKVDALRKKSLLSYFRYYFGFMMDSLVYGLKKFRRHSFDYVFVTSPPLFVGICGFILSRVHRANFILDIRDIWPDSAISAGLLKRNSMVYKAAHWIEKFLYRKADRILCVSQPMKSYISGFTAADKITVLYNGVSESDIRVLERSVPSLRSEGARAFQFMYAGNLGIVQGLDVLLEALYELRSQGYRDIRAVLIGDGIERNRLQEKCAAMDLQECVAFTGAMSKQQTLIRLLQSDCLFLHLIKDETLDKTIPSKVFDYLLLSKPIVYGIEGEGKLILDRLGVGCSFRQEDPASLAEAVKQIYHRTNEYRDRAVHTRDFVTQTFNRTNQFRHLGEQLRLGS